MNFERPDSELETRPLPPEKKKGKHHPGPDCACKNRPEREFEFHHGDRHGRCQTICMAWVLALGLTLGGFFPGYYYYKAKTDSNTVVVKGLAEKDVKADLAIWEMKYVVTGNDVVTAGKEIAKQTDIIKNFLLNHRINPQEITIGRLETNDLAANPYRTANEGSVRFILTQTITIKSTDVDLIASVLNRSGDLVAEGIIFNQDYGSPVSYLFTKLNEIKPEMLDEATKNAKQAAEQFAHNSGNRVGAIKYANQGVFSILPREQTVSASEQQQINKKVRVVSTVEYWLK